MRDGAVVFAIVLILVTACGRATPSSAPAPQAAPGEAIGRLAEPVSETWAPTPGRMIARRAELVLESSDVPRAAQALQSLASSLGGYTAEAMITTESGAGVPDQATLVLLVPANRLEELLSAVGTLDSVTRVQQTSLWDQDVTEEVIDYAARRRSLEETEVRLRGLLARAATIDEVLRVEQELARVRTELERIAAYQLDLERRVAFARVGILIVPPVQTSPPPLAETVRQAWDSSLVLLRLVVHGAVWAVVLTWWLSVPTLLTVALVVLVYRRRRARTAAA